MLICTLAPSDQKESRATLHFATVAQQIRGTPQPAPSTVITAAALGPADLLRYRKELLSVTTMLERERCLIPSAPSALPCTNTFKKRWSQEPQPEPEPELLPSYSPSYSPATHQAATLQLLPSSFRALPQLLSSYSTPIPQLLPSSSTASLQLLPSYFPATL